MNIVRTEDVFYFNKIWNLTDEWIGNLGKYEPFKPKKVVLKDCVRQFKSLIETKGDYPIHTIYDSKFIVQNILNIFFKYNLKVTIDGVYDMLFNYTVLAPMARELPWNRPRKKKKLNHKKYRKI